HTRSSTGALSRLVDLGLDPYLIGAGLSGIMAQRLVRTLCDHCKKRTNETWIAQGCDQCHDTGYSGRTAIYEILVPDDRVLTMLEDGAGQQAIQNHLLENTDFETLEQRGQELVDDGRTTREEIKRVLNI
ncbi:MAG: type II secretion system protein GspE, partial [bacterium]